jgi:PERQ amino acid-rich with GYF domain-containing protein
MVMPDRMKWQYKDHHGNTQGPFSGLEMHDWYKAGYFSPELLIKKLEDADYEPLAQLIRKIGNSREPFLVPQVGIPHDPPPQRSWTGPSNAGVQPPFPNSFPSFGTTLTAEQQNDLERRKQESQFLMARQKEHLAAQQLLVKMQQQIQPHGSATRRAPQVSTASPVLATLQDFRQAREYQGRWKELSELR